MYSAQSYVFIPIGDSTPGTRILSPGPEMRQVWEDGEGGTF